MRIVLSFPLFLILWEVDSPLNVLKWRMMAMNFLVYGLPLCVIIKLSDQPNKDQLLGPNSAKLYHYGLVCGNVHPRPWCNVATFFCCENVTSMLRVFARAGRRIHVVGGDTRGLDRRRAAEALA